MIRNTLIIILVSSILGYIASRTWMRHLITDDRGDLFLWTGGISFIILSFILVAEANFSTSTQTYVNRMGLSIIIVTGIFGVWGAFTEAGKRRFDEMDGMIPYLAMVGAVVLIVVLVILNIIWSVQTRSK